jgi:ATP-binding cassette subfamily B protein
MKYHTKLTFKIYWQHARKYKFFAGIVVLTVILAGIANTISPIFFKMFFDALTSGGAPANVGKTLVSILIIIFGIEMLGWFLWRVSGFANNYLQPKVMADLNNYCFAYLHKHSFSFFDNNFVGSLVKRVGRFVYAFEDITDRIIWTLLPLAVNIAVIFIVLVERNIYLGLIVLVWVIFFLVFNWILTLYKLKYDVLRSAAETKSTGILADTITNNANVKLFNGYDRERQTFAEANEEVRKLRKFTWDLHSWIDTGQSLLMVVLEIGIFYYAIGLWQEGLLTIGDFVLIQAYLINIFMRVWDFGRMIRRIYEDLADAEEMTTILDTSHGIIDAPGAKRLITAKGKIEFQNVTFNYHKTREVVSNLNLIIEPKEKLALVGPSGAGKSTLVKLLMRVYDLTSGKILIDGQSIAKVKMMSLWQNISFVPQEPILFHRSLMDNIRYGKPEATDKEVIQAARLAHCDEFIKEFPNGYKTFVGERGMKLSGGERQRVAIARAILRDAPILILDEATSSLDSESEQLIKESLDILMKGKTVIVIAHRLSTIMKMDRIIIIDRGGIVEEGKHEELLQKKGGLYEKLWKIQAGGFVE